jgi:hypothetical protein
MPLFGSKDDKSHRVQVLTLDYVVEGTAEISGQNLVYFVSLEDATMRSASGAASPEPRGTRWATGESFDGVVGVAALDEAGSEAVLEYAVTGKQELPADIYTGPYRVRGTLLASDDDPKVIANVTPMALRDAQVDCLAPGSALGSWQVPAIVLYGTQMQGVVLG